MSSRMVFSGALLGAILIVPCTSAPAAKIRKRFRSLAAEFTDAGASDEMRLPKDAEESATRTRKKQLDPGSARKEPKRSADEFIERELRQLTEKLDRDKQGIDPERLLDKLEAQFAKNYGQPLPGNARQSFVSLLTNSKPAAARTLPHNIARAPADIAMRGPQSTPDLPLPAWFTARDQDGDGQLGLYEWPRAERARFTELDTNGDGFLVTREARQ